MICKYFEISKFKDKNNFYLFYGENEGLKLETININFKDFNKENTHKYTEKEILDNKQIIFEKINSKSFFEDKRLILISEITDRSLDFIKEIIEIDVKDEKFILIAKKLEKRSKIRSFFEKDKNTLITPFYEDTRQILITIARKLLYENKINLSQENLNLIIERSQGDRTNLLNELNKIIIFSKNKKKISFEEINQITSLSENYSASELVDNCLSKNKKKTLNILNENIPSSEDNILILRTFLNKLKRLRKLRLNLDQNNNIDQVINSFKPPIFWKDKNIIKQQIKIWELNDIESFIVDLNNTESLIKRNPQISNQIINDMILNKFKETNIQT